MIMGRAASGTGVQRDPFRVDQDRALAPLEQAWTAGGYHGFGAKGGIWCAITSAGQGR